MPPNTNNTQNALKQQPPVTAIENTPATAKPAVPAARFDHPDSPSVLIFTPYDQYESNWVKSELSEEFAFMETPPSVVRELSKDQLFPGVVLYVATRAVARAKDPDTGRYGMVKHLRLSEPIHVKDYFGMSAAKKGGLNMQALQAKIETCLVKDPRGTFFVVRGTQDGGLKIHDN